MGKKRFAPYKKVYGTTRDKSKDLVTVVGRGAAPRTWEEASRPSLGPVKVERWTKAKLGSRSREDRAITNELVKKTLTPSQQADLAEQQQDLANSLSTSPPPPLNHSILAAENDWVDVDDDNHNNVDNEFDDNVIVEDLGFTLNSTTWSDRLLNETCAWSQQLGALCDAYLAFRNCEEASVGNTTTLLETNATDFDGSDAMHDRPPLDVDQSNEEITIPCLDIDCKESITFKHPASQQWVNATLLRHGFLSPSPSRPTIALSIRSLDVLAAFQESSPSLSVQSMSKAFCILQNIPYKRHFRNQLTAILDIYHQICREAERRLDAALGRDSPDWRLKNACPPCTYKLNDEPELPYSILVTGDGNDSLKRCSAAGAADHRVFDSNYFLPRNEVNRFENEVANSRGAARNRTRNEQDATHESECEKRWKVAKADKQGIRPPRAFFNETGVFVATCRHSFVLTVCDMIQSGELAKYGLATVNKLIEVFGSNILMGYDIGCTFKGTVARSALLGQRARDAKFEMCVGSFHGPAHNRACQLDNHAHNRKGAGLTDFENNETLFSSTNRLASVTRLASAYHRRQRIHIHLKAWDREQYAGLGHTERIKYINALKELERCEEAITRLNPSATEADLERFFEEERAFLASLKHELPEDVSAIEYLELLEQLDAKQTEYDKCQNLFCVDNSATSSDLRRATLTTARLETRRRATMNQLMMVQDQVLDMEDKLGIPSRWVRGGPEWVNANNIRQSRDFQQCVNELERLTILRILELSRAGIAGTGYKLRMHIMRAVASRSAALRSALARYNKAAALLDPPAPSIIWQSVADASILSDLDLLRNSRRQILDQLWAQPENRRCVEQYRRLQRAKEEIGRLNVEVRRFRTHLADEAVSLQAMEEKISITHPSLRWSVARYTCLRRAVNKVNLVQLQLIERLPGYSGTFGVGVRQGCDDSQATGDSSWLSTHPGDDVAEAEDDQPSLEIDDEIHERFARVQLALDSAA